MSDLGVQGEATAPAFEQSSARAGVLLREAREAQGLHIAALAVSLKVPVKKLEALEAGRFEELPDMVFARSLALSVCRTLKIDPTPIMASLPEPQASPFKANETSLNTTFKDSGGSSRRGVFAQISTPVGLAVLVLFVAIAVIATWPQTPLRGDVTQAAGDTSAPAMAADQQEPLAMAETASASEPTSDAPLSAAPTPMVVQTPVERPAEATSVANPASSIAAPVTDALNGAAQPAVLELSGRGDSWVEVTDAAGQSKLRKILTNGEVVRVAGQLPLSVTVGRADAVSVSVHGKPFDLTALARENVARFEVK